MNHTEALINRASRAYRRGEDGYYRQEPSTALSEVEPKSDTPLLNLRKTADVILKNVNGELARYRYYYKNDRLRRIKEDN